MDVYDIFGMLCWFIVVLAAWGWIGWGLCNDKLNKAKDENQSQAKEIEALKKKVLEQKKEIVFMKVEKATDLSKKR